MKHTSVHASVYQDVRILVSCRAVQHAVGDAWQPGIWRPKELHQLTVATGASVHTNKHKLSTKHPDRDGTHP